MQMPVKPTHKHVTCPSNVDEEGWAMGPGGMVVEQDKELRLHGLKFQLVWPLVIKNEMDALVRWTEAVDW